MRKSEIIRRFKTEKVVPNTIKYRRQTFRLSCYDFDGREVQFESETSNEWFSIYCQNRYDLDGRSDARIELHYGG